MWLLKGKRLINMDGLLDIHIEQDRDKEQFFLMAIGQKYDYCLGSFTHFSQAEESLQDLARLSKAHRIPKEVEK